MIKFILTIIPIIYLALYTYKPKSDNIPIIFREYGVEIYSVEKLGDTISYDKSTSEKFKIVFY